MSFTLVKFYPLLLTGVTPPQILVISYTCVGLNVMQLLLVFITMRSGYAGVNVTCSGPLKEAEMGGSDRSLANLFQEPR